MLPGNFMQFSNISQKLNFQSFSPIFDSKPYISPSPSPQSEHYPNNAKLSFNQKFPQINIDYYTQLTKQLLAQTYPKHCPDCNTLLTTEIQTRENAIRCPKCHFQGSRTSQTPLHNLRLPLWTFSYILTESLHMHPQVLSAAAIQRRLGVSNNTATLLKRRLQLFLREFIQPIKQIMSEEIKKEFGDTFRFPRDTTSDLTGLAENKPIISMDTVALFSARERSNGYRKRFRHHGQTSSIYLSDSVALEKGKYQIGTLVSTIGIKRGPVIFDSIPDQRQRTILPLLKFLPEHAPIFSDSGYPWLKRYNHNHREVNHSKRAKDRKRNVWSRERWSCCGVHSQTAEGFQRVLKHSFLSGYGYIRPEYSQLYLDEWCALRGLKLYGLERLNGLRSGGVSERAISPERQSEKHEKWSFKAKINRCLYNLPTPDLRVHGIHSKTRKQISKRLKIILDRNEYFPLRQAVEDYLFFWDEDNRERKQNESEYNALAHRLFSLLTEREHRSLNSVCNAGTINKKKAFRIVRIWAKLGVADVKEHRRYDNVEVNYIVKKLIPILPDLLYTYTLDDLKDLSDEWENVEIIRPERKERPGKYGLTQSERKHKIRRNK